MGWERSAPDPELYTAPAVAVDSAPQAAVAVYAHALTFDGCCPAFVFGGTSRPAVEHTDYTYFTCLTEIIHPDH